MSRFTFEQTAQIQRHVRAAMTPELDVTGAYEEAVRALQMMQEDAGVAIIGHPEGWYVDSRNQLRPIPNSGVPHNEPVARPLQVVSADSIEDEEAPIILAEDLPDNVDPEAEIDPDADLETERFEQAADAAASGGEDLGESNLNRRYRAK